MRRLAVAFLVIVALSLSTSAEAFTTSLQSGTPGKLWLFRNIYTGATPEVQCYWDGAQAGMTLPGYFAGRAPYHKGHRETLFTRYIIEFYSFTQRDWFTYTATPWQRHRIGAYQRKVSVIGQQIHVARHDAYEVYVDAVWALRWTNIRRLGSRINYFDYYDFNLANQGDPFNPITYNTSGGVGWCQFS